MEKSNEFKEKSKISYDKLASSYDSTYYGGKHAQNLYEHVIKTMSRFEYTSVLDVGCGTGSLLSEILKIKKVMIAGIDISEKMLEIAKDRLGDEADLRNGDSEHLPWKNNSFDMVICTDSFHHYPNPKAVLKEIRRVTGPGGKIIIADPWAPTPFRQMANLILPLRKGGDVRLYSEPEMKNLLEESGFKLVSWEKIGIQAYILVATAV